MYLVAVIVLSNAFFHPQFQFISPRVRFRCNLTVSCLPVNHSSDPVNCCLYKLDPVIHTAVFSSSPYFRTDDIRQKDLYFQNVDFIFYKYVSSIVAWRLIGFYKLNLDSKLYNSQSSLRSCFTSVSLLKRTENFVVIAEWKMLEVTGTWSAAMVRNINCVFYGMHLNKFFWEGISKFYQNLKGIHGPKV
jgi:hypothetical protein